MALDILAVFIPLQLSIMGWFGGIGLLGKLKDIRMGRMPGNSPEHEFDSITSIVNSPLAWEKICALGFPWHTVLFPGRIHTRTVSGACNFLWVRKMRRYSAQNTGK